MKTLHAFDIVISQLNRLRHLLFRLRRRVAWGLFLCGGRYE